MSDIKPITVDCRKRGYEELYAYINLYAELKSIKPASAVLEIIKDHKAQATGENQTIKLVQGKTVLVEEVR